MCVIIDANVASEAFARKPSDDAAAVIEWIESGDGRLVFGGKLAEELLKVGEARRYLLALANAGRAIRVRRSDVEKETNRIKRGKQIASNDPHVIALARVSGARILFSRDKKLHKDFKNRSLVDNPGGRIYTSRGHVRLLHHDRSCRYSPR